jgi:hypothetical protein
MTHLLLYIAPGSHTQPPAIVYPGVGSSQVERFFTVKRFIHLTKGFKVMKTQES